MNIQDRLRGQGVEGLGRRQDIETRVPAVEDVHQLDLRCQEGKVLGRLGEGPELADRGAQRRLGRVGRGQVEVRQLQNELGVLEGTAAGDPFIGLLQRQADTGDAIGEEPVQRHLIELGEARHVDDLGQHEGCGELVLVEQ